jgi:hypothetical protein
MNSNCAPMNCLDVVAWLLYRAKWRSAGAALQTAAKLDESGAAGMGVVCCRCATVLATYSTNKQRIWAHQIRKIVCVGS